VLTWSCCLHQYNQPVPKIPLYIMHNPTALLQFPLAPTILNFSTDWMMATEPKRMYHNSLDISPHLGAILLTDYYQATGTIAYYPNSALCLKPAANDFFISTLWYINILLLWLCAVRPKHTYISLILHFSNYDFSTAMSLFQWYQLLGINTTQ